jgi:signal transduction histidine kinase
MLGGMRLGARFTAFGKALVLMLMFPISVGLFVLTTLSIAFIGLGVGLVTTPAVLTVVRGYANMRRALLRAWFGYEVARPYRPMPQYGRSLVGMVQRTTWRLRDQATWRDLILLITDATACFALATAVTSLFAEGAYGYVLAAGVWKPVYRANLRDGSGNSDWYTFVNVNSQSHANLCWWVGSGLILIGFVVGPALLRGGARVDRALLMPTEKALLALRVAQLTESRADALDVQAAEIRRIERDLHDGAQARIVAMGMNLGAAEALIETNPDAAKALLSEVRDSSAKALDELRNLVRGIHPPVLAERGLGDAIKALALASPIRVDVTVELAGRLEAPVESAAYFAVSEALTNVIKHAGAHTATIDVRHDGRTLRISVTDDGVGGADAGRGTGLRGVERRLGTFDGVLALSSPRGGPTMVMMELPCALSSPKTSSS